MRVLIYLVTTVGAFAALATTANPSSGSSCQSNRTYQQAARVGELPGIVAALHGGASEPSLLDCVAPKR